MEFNGNVGGSSKERKSLESNNKCLIRSIYSNQIKKVIEVLCLVCDPPSSYDFDLEFGFYFESFPYVFIFGNSYIILGLRLCILDY